MPANLAHAAEQLRLDLVREAGGTGVELVSTIEDAAAPADLVIDCIPDELESKLEILWLLDRMAPPRAVLATPTIRQSVADLAACTYRADRCVGLAVDPRALEASTPVRVRTLPGTAEATLALLDGFFRQIGMAVEFEVEPGS